MFFTIKLIKAIIEILIILILFSLIIPFLLGGASVSGQTPVVAIPGKAISWWINNLTNLLTTLFEEAIKKALENGL